MSEFGTSLGALNSFFNELAYKPKGSRQSFLFYLPWLNHDINSSFNLTDSRGPIGRGLVMLTCTSSYLAYGVAPLKPYLNTLLQGLQVPKPSELPSIPRDPKSGPNGPECGPSAE